MNWIHHPLIHDLGLTLLHFLWQGVLIGMLYAGSRYWFRNASAGYRYALAVLTLVVLAITPPATLLWLMTQAPVAATAEPAAAVVAGTLTLEAVLARSAPLVGLAPWVVGIWLAGVLLLSLRLLAGWHYLATLRRSADRAAARHLRPRLEMLAQRMGVHRHVRVARSDRVESPLLLGWIRPVILLPASVIAGFPARQLEMVLVHELAHVKRHDHLVNLFQTVVETLLFYHPVVAWVSRHVRLERENACDDLAVSAARDRVGYVEMLAALENLRHDDFRLAMAVNDGQVLTRIRRLLAPQGRRGYGMIGPLVAILTAVAGITGLSWLPLDGDDPQTTSETRVAESAEPVHPDRQDVLQVRPLELELPLLETDTVPAVTSAETPPAVAGPQTEPDRTAAAADPGVAVGESGADRPVAETPALETPVTEPTEVSAEAVPTGVAIAGNGESGGTEPMPDTEEVMLESGLALAALGTVPAPPPHAAAEAPAGGGEEPPIAGGDILERVSPEYPTRARRRQANGSVQVAFTVRRDGSVADIEILKENPRNLSFGRAARDAIAQWRFEPFRRGENPVDRRIQMEVEFDLGEEACGPRTGTRISHC